MTMAKSTSIMSFRSLLTANNLRQNRIWLSPRLAAFCTGPRVEAPKSGHIQLTRRQHKQYDDDGVLIIRRALSEWTNFAREFVENEEQRWADCGRINNKPHKALRLRTDIVLAITKRYENMGAELHRTCPEFQHMLTCSPLAGICAQLLRADSLRMPVSIVLDTPLTAGPGWHQDTSAVGPTKREDAIRFWLPLDPCGQDGTGVNPFLLGSHKNTHIRPGQQHIPADFPERYKQLVPELEPGDLVVYSPAAVHRSPLPSSRRRRVITGTFCRGDALYDGGQDNGAERFWRAAALRPGDTFDDPTAPLVYPPPAGGAQSINWGECIGRTPSAVVESLFKDMLIPFFWDLKSRARSVL